ncbi:MAG: ATP-binding protein [Chloroflexota bacterium]
MNAEKARLDNLAALTAQRPTLQRLLREQDRAELLAYLRPYQTEAETDILIVYDTAGVAFTNGDPTISCTPSLTLQTAALCLTTGESPQVALLSSQLVLDSHSGGLLGSVTIGAILDDAFEEQLAAETGLEQSILLNGRFLSSSLPDADRAQVKQTATTDIITVAGRYYYTTRFPLYPLNSDTAVFIEVALPVTALITAQRRVLLTLIGSTLFVAAAGSIASILLRNAVKKEAVQHLRAHFLANITHEFRTPLSALRASVEYLDTEAANLSRAEINSLLHAIHMSVIGLQTLIDNLLESISIEAGHFVIHPEPTELNDVIDDAIRIMQPLLDRRQQKLVVSYPSPLPLVQGDPSRLTQVFVNLLANASKYGPMAETIKITVTPAENGQIKVAVADQGPGISPTIQGQLFHRFIRFDTPHAAQHGVGLGLWVVKAIITGHAGQVGIESQVDGGSVFWFTLPITTNHK